MSGGSRAFSHRALFAQGFMATRAPTRDIPSHFTNCGVVGEYVVHADGRIPVGRLDVPGVRGLLIGFAGTVGEQATALEELCEAVQRGGAAALISALDLLVGRWVLLLETHDGIAAYHDAIGARSVYFALDGSCVASHVGLIKRNHPDSSVRDRQPRAVTEHYALDHTELDDVRALLPNFRLHLPEGSVERYYPVRRNRQENLSVAQLLLRIERLWRAGSDWALSLPLRHVAALTAGHDSRLLAAMQHDRGVDIEYFTYREDSDDESNFSVRTWNEDVRIGRALARQIGARHDVLAFRRGATPEESRAVLAQNAPLGHLTELADTYARRYGELQAVLHRSTALEIGREYFFSPNFTGTREEEIRHLCTIEFGKDPDGSDRPESLESIVERYLATMGVLRASRLGYSATSLLYWEVRCGRFHSEVLNGMDATFIPLNGFASRALWDAILALPEDLRRENWLHFALISRNAPALNALPLNGEDVFARLSEAAFRSRAGMGAIVARDASDAAVEMRTGTQTGGRPLLDSVRADLLFVPAKTLAEAGWAEAVSRFSFASGGAELEFRSPYVLGRATACLRLELRVNDDVVAYEDIGHTDETIRARIAGLQRGDVVSLRVAALRPLPQSWERASRVELVSWRTTHHRGDAAQQRSVGWSSPWGVTSEVHDE